MLLQLQETEIERDFLPFYLCRELREPRRAWDLTNIEGIILHIYAFT